MSFIKPRNPTPEGLRTRKYSVSRFSSAFTTFPLKFVTEYGGQNKLASTNEAAPFYRFMRVLFIALMVLMPTVSLWAQGQIVAVGPSSQIQDNIIDGNLPVLVVTVPPWPISSQVLLTASNLPLTEPPSALAIEAITATINLTDVNFEATVNLSSTTIVVGQVNFITGVNYGGDSSGAEMIEANRSKPGISEFPIFPPTPESQIQFPQASEIQPAPEPSTFALCSLALGLIAFFRASVKAKNVA
jgi:hypothetical protein